MVRIFRRERRQIVVYIHERMNDGAGVCKAVSLMLRILDFTASAFWEDIQRRSAMVQFAHFKSPAWCLCGGWMKKGPTEGVGRPE